MIPIQHPSKRTLAVFTAWKKIDSEVIPDVTGPKGGLSAMLRDTFWNLYSEDPAGEQADRLDSYTLCFSDISRFIPDEDRPDILSKFAQDSAKNELWDNLLEIIEIVPVTTRTLKIMISVTLQAHSTVFWHRMMSDANWTRFQIQTKRYATSTRAQERKGWVELYEHFWKEVDRLEHTPLISLRGVKGHPKLDFTQIEPVDQLPSSKLPFFWVMEQNLTLVPYLILELGLNLTIIEALQMQGTFIV